MPRDGAIIFGDLIGKLDLLRIECPKCGRSGRYRLADLLMRYGRNETFQIVGGPLGLFGPGGPWPGERGPTAPQ